LDTSHLEFTIADYYYFGKLSDLLLNSGFLVDEVKDFDTLNRYDTIVFNYPEKPFNDAEVNKIDSWVRQGKVVILQATTKTRTELGRT